MTKMLRHATHKPISIKAPHPARHRADRHANKGKHPYRKGGIVGALVLAALLAPSAEKTFYHEDVPRTEVAGEILNTQNASTLASKQDIITIPAGARLQSDTKVRHVGQNVEHWLNELAINDHGANITVTTLNLPNDNGGKTKYESVTVSDDHGHVLNALVDPHKRPGHQVVQATVQNERHDIVTDATTWRSGVGMVQSDRLIGDGGGLSDGYNLHDSKRAPESASNLTREFYDMQNTIVGVHVSNR